LNDEGVVYFPKNRRRLAELFERFHQTRLSTGGRVGLYGAGFGGFVERFVESGDEGFCFACLFCSDQLLELSERGLDGRLSAQIKDTLSFRNAECLFCR